MTRLAAGTALAAVAMFVWGMLFWGANPLPYRAWKQPTDDVGAGQALRTYFPETGTYAVPGRHHDARMRLDSKVWSSSTRWPSSR